MGRLGAFLLVLLMGFFVVLFFVLAQIVSEVGEARVYGDLAAGALLAVLLAAGITFTAVLLSGLARLAESRNAHKAQPVERQTIIKERVLDGRLPAGPPNIITLDRNGGDLRSLYPDLARAAIQGGMGQRQLEPPDVYEPALPADAWAQLETLFKD